VPLPKRCFTPNVDEAERCIFVEEGVELGGRNLAIHRTT
jgi:hypothetical protein